MSGLQILALLLGLVQLVAAPIVPVTIHRAATGAARRGGMAGIRIPATNASDEAWLAGHRAADAVAPKLLLLELLPVVVGMVVSFWSPWVGLVLVCLGMVAQIITTVWTTRVARTAAESVHQA